MDAPITFTVGPETARLAHRAFTVSDAELAFTLNSDPDVLRYTGETPLESVDDARRFIDMIGLDRIVAFVMPKNHASIRVLEKSGMQFDGEFDYDGIPTFRFLIASSTSH